MTTPKTRIEHDLLGDFAVPADPQREGSAFVRCSDTLS
jgi:hypothetical protein